MAKGEANILNKYPNRPTPNQDGPRVNEQIRAPQIRLIDENGNMVGVTTVADGIRRAQDAGLDLIEISPTAEPPVCKISDFGKYKYELQKKKNEAKKKQKVIEIKEIKLRPMIGENDYQVKLRSMRKFLEDEDKVKVTMRFRGREGANQDLSKRLFDRIKKDLEDLGKVESESRFDGRQIIMVFVPLK
jgi:translation initiation factor IF-3